MLREGRIAEAETIFAKAIGIAPDLATARLIQGLAEALFGLGQYRACFDKYDQTLAKRSDYSRLWAKRPRLTKRAESVVYMTKNSQSHNDLVLKGEAVQKARVVEAA